MKKVVLLNKITYTITVFWKMDFLSSAYFNWQLLKSIVFNETCTIKKMIRINIKVRKREGEVAER